MDLLKPLIDAVLAGAAAGASGVATEAITSAYAAVKEQLGARLSNWAQIERKPDSPAFRAAAEEELADHQDLAGDADLLARVNALQSALRDLPAEQARTAGIDIRRLSAGQELVVARLQATGPVTLHDVQAGGSIRIEDIGAGSPTKNG